MSRALAVALLAASLSACAPDATPSARGEARLAVFRECMELAAKMPRQADDDVSDVVNACSNQAYYMTNHVTGGATGGSK